MLERDIIKELDNGCEYCNNTDYIMVGLENYCAGCGTLLNIFDKESKQ